MKKWIAFLLMIAMVFSVAACSANPESTSSDETPAEEPAVEDAPEEETPDSDEKIVLRMIDTLASETRTAALQAIIDKYEAAHENITIELIAPPTDGADQKVQQMLMAGEPLDIIDTGNAFQVCVNNGWVQPLNQYLADWEELDTISSAAASRMTLLDPERETMWCIPYGIYQKLLFYRKDILADAGIEIPEVWTWEDIYEIASTVTNPEAGIYGWAFRGGARGCTNYDYLMYSFMDDAEVLDDENYRAFAPDGSVVYRSETAMEALEFYKSLYTDCAPPDSISWGFTEMVQGFMSGTCALLLQDNDVIQSCESGLDPELWGVGNVPLGSSGYGTQSAGYGGWALTSHSQHPEQAADFIRYLSSAENNGYFCQQTGLIPIHTTTIESDPYFSSGVYTVFNQMDELGAYRIFSSHGVAYDCAATFDTDRDEYLQKYLLGEVSGEDLLDYWASTWEEAYTAQGKLW